MNKYDTLAIVQCLAGLLGAIAVVVIANVISYYQHIELNVLVVAGIAFVAAIGVPTFLNPEISNLILGPETKAISGDGQVKQIETTPPGSPASEKPD